MPLRLGQTVRIGASLEIELTTVNAGQDETVVSEGLHSYFLVGDIAETAVAVRARPEVGRSWW